MHFSSNPASASSSGAQVSPIAGLVRTGGLFNAAASASRFVPSDSSDWILYSIPGAGRTGTALFLF